MSSIVLELQNEVTKPNCDIVNVLRKAHLVAAKLNLAEFDNWISCELNGYKNEDVIPDYREVRGILQALNPYRGWIPVVISSSLVERNICFNKIPTSISEIKTLCEKSENSLVLALPGETQNQLNSTSTAPFETYYRIEISASSVENIIEMVKNTILEWTIKLEAEGILGEGMRFNSTEKETAKRIPQTINNYYGNPNIINAPINHSAISVGDNITIGFPYEAVEDTVSEIEKQLDTEKLSSEDFEAAIEMLAEIKEKISQQKKPSIIKAGLAGLRDFLIGVGASTTVALIQAKTQGLF